MSSPGVLRRAPDALAIARADGAAGLALMSLWAERSRLDLLLEESVTWASAMATDFEVRADGMDAAESLARSLWTSRDEDHVYVRFSLGPTEDRLVREAVHSLESLLSTNGFKILFFNHGDTTVSEQDLRDTIAVIIGLSPAALRAVLARLEADTLEKWLAIVEHRGVEEHILVDLFRHVASERDRHPARRHGASGGWTRTYAHARCNCGRDEERGPVLGVPIGVQPPRPRSTGGC